MSLSKDPKDAPVFPESPDIDVAHVEHVEHSRSESSGSQPRFAEHGIPIDRSRTAEALDKKDSKYLWPRIRQTLQEPFSEFLGTFILLMFGDGVVAQVVLSNGTKGSYQSISWGWGLGVMLGVYVAGCVSVLTL